MRVSDTSKQNQSTRSFQFTGRIRSFYHAACGIFDSLPAQCVDPRRRYSSGSPHRLVLPYFERGLVLDHSCDFHRLDSRSFEHGV